MLSSCRQDPIKRRVLSKAFQSSLCSPWDPSLAIQVKRALKKLDGMQEYEDETKEIPRPENWGGWRIQPEMIEFWHGRKSRLHDRLRFRRSEGAWIMERLSP